MADQPKNSEQKYPLRSLVQITDGKEMLDGIIVGAFLGYSTIGEEMPLMCFTSGKCECFKVGQGRCGLHSQEALYSVEFGIAQTKVCVTESDLILVEAGE